MSSERWTRFSEPDLSRNGWIPEWDPSNRYKLSDAPDVPHIVPSIRLNGFGNPVKRVVAGIYSKDAEAYAFIEFNPESELYEIVLRISDDGSKDLYGTSADLDRALSGFIMEFCEPGLINPMSLVLVTAVKEPAYKTETYGRWA